MTEDDGERFFYQALPKVAAAFAASDVSRVQAALGQTWNYDLCNLPLRRGQPLLLGLNPGRDPNDPHPAQTRYPTDAQHDIIVQWRFVNRSRPWIEQYVGPLHSLNYFNVCPFRAPRSTDLSNRDWQLGIESFFRDAIDVVAPPKTAILGTSAVAKLESLGLATAKIVSIDGERQVVNARVGSLLGRSGTRYPFFAVPAPTNALSDDDRHAIWRAATDAM